MGTPTRFAIIALPRTGTHMLRTALDGHPQITCHAEIFNPHHPAGKHGHTDLDAILEHVAFSSRDVHTRACGFCVHFFRPDSVVETAPQEAFPDLFTEDALPHHLESVRIVTLTRRNLLERQISFSVARRTGRWTATRPTLGRPRPLILNPERLFADLDRAERLTRQLLTRFDGALHLTYEDLTTGWAPSCARVLEHLGVERADAPLSPTTLKQGRPARETVRNYDALARAAEGTRFAIYFDEP